MDFDLVLQYINLSVADGNTTSTFQLAVLYMEFSIAVAMIIANFA